MIYKEEKNFPDKPNLNFGNGDGTVNIRSLRGCMRWSPKKRLSVIRRSHSPRRNYDRLAKWNWVSELKKEGVRTQRSAVHHQEFPGVNHMEILRAEGVVTYIRDAVQKINSDQS